MMTKCLLLIIALVELIFFSSYASAGWQKIGENIEQGITIYSDFKSIKGGPLYVQLTTLYDFMTVNKEFGYSHLSEVEHNEYDCKLKKVRLIDFAWYSKPSGKGEVVWSGRHAQPWANIPAGSVHMTNWNVVCKMR